jgi:hypothetical protein
LLLTENKSAFDNNNGYRHDRDSLLCADLQEFVVNRLVERFTFFFQKTKTFHQQLEIDLLGVIEVGLLVYSFDLLNNFFLMLFIAFNNDTACARSTLTTEIASQREVEID